MWVKKWSKVLFPNIVPGPNIWGENGQKLGHGEEGGGMSPERAKRVRKGLQAGGRDWVGGACLSSERSERARVSGEGGRGYRGLVAPMHRVCVLG